MHGEQGTSQVLFSRTKYYPKVLSLKYPDGECGVPLHPLGPVMPPMQGTSEVLCLSTDFQYKVLSLSTKPEVPCSHEASDAVSPVMT
jgi:hypothetical protein